MTTLMKRNGGLNLLPELPSLFDDPFLRNWFNWSNTDTGHESGTLPSVNISETDESYEISVAAPGMSKNDFKVELENNRLVISGEKKEERENKQEQNYLRREFNYQSFVRSFTLAEKQIHSEKIQAKYAEGILHITVPKSAEAKTKAARIIQVS